MKEQREVPPAELLPGFRASNLMRRPILTIMVLVLISVLPVVLFSAWGYPPLVHVPVLAAAKRGVFEPYTFSDSGQGLQLLTKRRSVPIRMTDFDYLLEIGHPPQFKIPIGLSLTEIQRGHTYILYRIKR